MNGICLQCGNGYPSLFNKFIKQNGKHAVRTGHDPKNHKERGHGQQNEPKSHNSRSKSAHIFLNNYKL